MRDIMVEFKKCRKCNANRIGFQWIQNRVRDMILSNKDPRTGAESHNILNVLSAAHASPEINKDGKFPCSMCLSEYGQMINDAVYLFKKQK